MGLIGRQESPVPPNEPPEWVSTPNPNSFIDSVAANYDLSVHVFDQEDDDLTYSINAGSTALPSGITLNTDTGLLVADGTQVSGTTAGIIIDVKDAGSGLVPSDSFSIVVNTGAVRAFPLAEGFGTETSHGRGGIVVQVTNLNDSGAGSLREALRTEEPRIVIFRVSGTIFVESKIVLGGEHSDVGIFGQTAPGGGICIAADSEWNGVTVQISKLNDVDAVLDECHDVVFQHIRFRHGSVKRTPHVANNDCFDAHAGTHHLVIDHCSFSWASDENITFWNGSYDDSVTDMHDMTMSHCIIAEGDQAHNTGHLVSGGDDANDKIFNYTYHHNLGAHLGFRDVSNSTGSGDSTKGTQAINNVHYDSLQHHAFGQTQYTNQQLFFDCINEVNIRSSRENATGNRKFNVSRLYTLTGDEGFTPQAFDHSKVRRSPPPDVDQDAGVWHPPSLYVTGSIQREIDLSDTTPSSASAEADNTEWIVYQYKGLTGGGGPYDGGETHAERVVPLATQPTNPVTTTTALQAHTDLIVNGDVGALPHDSVDARIVAAVTSGAVYDRYNVPGYPGSTAVWPTLTDTGAPTDTSGNGLPDSYQVGVLGKSADDAYNPANTFTVGNGYSDIENWIHTL